MAKYATKECYKCHLRRPVTEMKAKTVEKRTGSSLGVYNIGSGGKNKASVRAYYRKKTVWQCSPRSACGDPQYFERMAAEKALLDERIYNLNQLADDSKNWDLVNKISNPLSYDKYFIEIENELDELAKSYPKLKNEILKIKSEIPYETTPKDIANYIFTPNIKNTNTSLQDSIFAYKKPEGKVEKIDNFLKKSSDQNNIQSGGFLYYKPIWFIAFMSYLAYLSQGADSSEFFAIFVLTYLILFFYRMAKRKTLNNSSYKKFIYIKINNATEKLKQQLTHDTGNFLNILNRQIIKSGKSYNLTNWGAFDEYTELKLNLDFLSIDRDTKKEVQNTVYSEKKYKKTLKLAIFGGLIGAHRAYLSKSKMIAVLMYIKTTAINILAITNGLIGFPIIIWIIEILSVRAKIMLDENGLTVVPDKMKIIANNTKVGKHEKDSTNQKNILKNTSFLISKNRSVQRTVKDFTEQFGIAIRIYKGKRIADNKLKIFTLSDVDFGSKINIDISISTTVGELEDQFFDLCGLTVQIESPTGALANDTQVFFDLIQTK